MQLPRTRQSDARPFSALKLVKEVLVVLIIQRVELILCTNATIERFAILPELDILQAAGNTTIAVSVERIEVKPMNKKAR